jgi:hypothetical protein
MKVSATGGNTERKVAPQGVHVARCYQIIDLGTTEDLKFGGRKRKIQFLFELPLELAVFDETKGEQPYYCRTVMTLSMAEKANLRKFIESWIGKTMTDKEASSFEIFDLLGKTGMVNISHRVTENGTYANIMSITPMPKGMQCPEPFNQAICYDTTMHDANVFSLLPEFVREQIEQSDEYKLRTSKPEFTAPAAKSLTDDIDALFFNNNDENPFI